MSEMSFEEVLDKYREANYQTAAEYRKRDNFVEAMRVLVKLPGYLNAKRQAAEAFADAKCRLASRGDTHKTGLCYRKESDSIEPHTACRAALLKEIGL